MHPDRRQFIKASAAVGSSLAMNVSSTMATNSDLLPIIDTHQHLWDLEKFVLPWIAGDDAPPVLKRSHVTSDYLKATEGLHGVKAIYMEVDVREDQQVKEAEHVIALARSSDHPTVAAVISGRPSSDSFAGYMAGFKDTPEVKGVRQVLHGTGTPKGFCLQEKMVSGVRLLGEMGKSFDLCMRPTELSDGAKLAEKCPETLCIVDHCGNADPKAWLPEARRAGQEPGHQVDAWKHGIEALAKQSNTICKISGIIARATKDWKAEDLAEPIHFCLDTFGPDRVVFGSDWPVCTLTATYRDWVAALKEVIASRSKEDQQKLLHDNAVKFYRLS